jgi:hypothetical protein
MRLANLQWSIGSNVALWDVNGSERRIEYAQPIRSAVALGDRSGVAVVEPLITYGQSNAVILNADGSLRFRLDLPVKDGSVYGFDQIYYVNDELTAIVAFTGHDFAYVVDERDGRYLRHYETR